MDEFTTVETQNVGPADFSQTLVTSTKLHSAMSQKTVILTTVRSSKLRRKMAFLIEYCTGFVVSYMTPLQSGEGTKIF